MRLLTLILIATGSAASAHPGHLVDAAGHNHWVAGIALGAAGIAIVLGALKDRKGKAARDPEPEAQSA
ncbi:DUF6732 family protein [Loktanella sp. M215]|uniref:DUF6732 family protein n=1 Tax=Loktanella sp. M215 TaxID=2675431 RepID=UPI001F3D10FE|nr:DUF6732 family protein [Loktanella sp. M215]MCF7697732.1 hypothetical protein [Loktanella sp. M215]